VGSPEGRSIRCGREEDVTIGERRQRRILANLLAKDKLAVRRSSPPRSVLETVARMAPRLRDFAREGDRLWAPAPVDPESVPKVPGLPRPIFESGPLRALPPLA